LVGNSLSQAATKHLAAMVLNKTVAMFFSKQMMLSEFPSKPDTQLTQKLAGFTHPTIIQSVTFTILHLI